MSHIFRNIFTISILAILFSACRTKDKTTITPVVETNKVKIELFNMVGNSTLNMGNQWYLNEHNDSFKVSTFKYYISNIKLNSSNSVYSETYSYHLVKQDDLTTTSFDMSSVPYGSYNSITFTIGVDSLHNVSGPQTGALDPINDMFWSWTTGYIMLKFEGSSPQCPQPNGAITLHSGGFTGVYNVLKTVTLNFPTPITVGSIAENHIHIKADVLALFKSPNVINFATLNVIHAPGADAKLFADNYANMFNVTYAGL